CVLIASAYSNARVLERVQTIHEKVRRISERLAREHPDVPHFVENHYLIETLASINLAFSGEHARATDSAEQAVTRAPRSGMVRNYAACCYAVASRTARTDPSLPPARR